MTASRERCWRFQCTECGMGDHEMGQLAADHETWCEVCLSEDGRHVSLRRWAVTPDDPTATAPAARTE